MDIAVGNRVEDAFATLAVLIIGYLLFGLALWLQFPQPKSQGVRACAKGVALLPILYVVGFLLRRGKMR